MDLATRREPRQPIPRCGGRRPLQRRWATFRLPHPPGPDPRPRWTRRDAERPELVARPQRRRRLAARLATRRPEASAAISDRPNRLDRGMRPRRRARRHNELYCGHVDWLLEPWNHQAIRGGRRRRAGGSGDGSVDRGDYCSRRLEPGWCHRAGCRRPDRAGALLASRRRLGARDDHIRLVGRQRRCLRRDRHLQGRRSVRWLRPGWQRSELGGERRHECDRERTRPRRHDLRRERDAPGGVRSRQWRDGHPERRAGPRSRVDSVVHGRGEGHRRVRRRRPGCSRRLG